MALCSSKQREHFQAYEIPFFSPQPPLKPRKALDHPQNQQIRRQNGHLVPRSHPIRRQPVRFPRTCQKKTRRCNLWNYYYHWRWIATLDPKIDNFCNLGTSSKIQKETTKINEPRDNLVSVQKVSKFTKKELFSVQSSKIKWRIYGIKAKLL